MKHSDTGRARVMKHDRRSFLRAGAISIADRGNLFTTAKFSDAGPSAAITSSFISMR